jgi:cytochrome c553
MQLALGLGASAVPCTGLGAAPSDPLAQSCQTCHSPAVDAAAMPDLSRYPPEELARALRTARDRPAPGSIMGRFARGLSDDDIRALSLAFQAAPKAPQ